MKKNLIVVSVAFALSVFAFRSLAQIADAGTNEVIEAEVAEVAEVAEEAAAPKENTQFDEMVHYIQQGGKTMWFIGLLSILGLGCALERFYNMRRSRIVPDGFSAEVISLWREGKFDEIETKCEASRSMLARVVETMLSHRSSEDYQEVKLFAEDKAGRELRLENRKSAMLSTVATLAPLLGLFGTVVGLLGAFGTVAAMGEMGDASVLADDIGKALVTTVAGLAVSMPALFIFNIIKDRLNLYSVVLEEEISDLVNQLFIEKA